MGIIVARWESVKLLCMTLVPTSQLVDEARAAGTGIAAFNVIDLEYAEAVATAAAHAGEPAIVQISANAVHFHEGRIEPLVRACVALAEDVEAPLALHLDHAEDVELCRRAVAAGCSSVMFDAGGLSAEDAVAATAQAAEWAHAEGVWIEGELDDIGGKPGERASSGSDPAAAATFVERTGVDGLAVAVGSRHKMTAATASLDFELIGRLREAVRVPLVLHGSSGVPDAALREATARGIVKVNVGTRLGAAFTRALHERLGHEPPADPRPALEAARSAASSEAERVIRALRRH